MRTIILSFMFVGIFAACDSKSGSTNSDRDDNSATTNSDSRDGDDGTVSSDKKDDGLFGDRKDTKDGDDRRDGNLLGRDDGEDRVDESLARAGRTLFASQCMSCHKINDDERKADQSETKQEMDAPDLSDITDKRSDRFLVRFMTNSDGEDNDPKKNDDKNDVCRLQMPGKQLSRDHALKVLEYMHLQAKRD